MQPLFSLPFLYTGTSSTTPSALAESICTSIRHCKKWTTARPPEAGWKVRKNETSRTGVVPLSRAGKGETGLSGHALEIACWTTGGGSQTGGLSLKLGNYNHANEGLGDGYDELFIRYYIMFDENYRAVRNHGANLGGRDVTRKDAAWVGMAGIRDVSTRGYFYSGVQPRGKAGSAKLKMGFYSYHLDKKGPWGENYEVKKKIPVRVGRWYCVERHLKLNSVDPNTAGTAVITCLSYLLAPGVGWGIGFVLGSFFIVRRRVKFP